MYPIGGRLTIGRGRCRGEKPATCINPGDQHTRFPLSPVVHIVYVVNSSVFCAAEHWWRWVRSPRLIMQGAGSGEVSCPSTLPPTTSESTLAHCTLPVVAVFALSISSLNLQYIAYHPSLNEGKNCTLTYIHNQASKLYTRIRYAIFPQCKLQKKCTKAK